MLMVSAGVAALTAAPSGAEAAGLIDSQEMEQRCLGVGGQVARDDSDGQYRCSTPALDDRCNYPARYDNAGNRLTYVYDVRSGTCEEANCFLTTACVDCAGLPDDCFELSTLRRFRDTVLMQMPGGPDDVALYCRVAPSIVARIGASPNRSRELARLYVLYILPSVFAAWLGQARLTRRIYTRMMRDLAGRYRIAPI